MNLLQLVRQPLVQVQEGDTVHQTVEAMVLHHVGAAAVLSEGRLAGIFTERDLMRRVIAKDLAPKTTRVADVMSSPVMTLAPETDAVEAMRMMMKRQFRHILLVDAQGKLVAMLSLRDLLRQQVEELDRELNSVIERYTNDSPGG